MRVFFIIVILCEIIFYSINGFASDNSIFEKIVKNSLQILTVEADISQDIFENSRSHRYEGHFISSKSGKFRIDYSFPSYQIVVFNGKNLRWYFKDVKIVYNSQKKLFRDLKDSILIGVKKRDIARVKYLGKSWYSFLKIVSKYEFIFNNTKTLFWIDMDMGVVLKKVLIDKNGFQLIDERYSNYINIDGIYFPQTVVVRSRKKNGIVISKTKYSNISLNSKINVGLFNLKIPNGVDFKEMKFAD